MTYPVLLSVVFASYDRLLAQWDEEMEKAGNIGVFAFLPEGYTTVPCLQDARYTFWPLDVVKAYLFKGGKTDEGLLELLKDFEFGEEFLVMIVE